MKLLCSTSVWNWCFQWKTSQYQFRKAVVNQSIALCWGQLSPIIMLYWLFSYYPRISRTCVQCLYKKLAYFKIRTISEPADYSGNDSWCSYLTNWKLHFCPTGRGNYQCSLSGTYCWYYFQLRLSNRSIKVAGILLNFCWILQIHNSVIRILKYSKRCR